MNLKTEPVRLFEVLRVDDTLPVDPKVLELWLKDMQNPLRQAVLPLIRILCSTTLYTGYFLRRLIPLPFKAHRLLQWLICVFMKYFVTPEANVLILRHFGAESNLLNFIVDNSQAKNVAPALLYPKKISDLMQDTFVEHDQALFRVLRDLGSCKDEKWPISSKKLSWKNWKSLDLEYQPTHKKWFQFLDFETAHELFKTIFCLLLTAREYEDAINSFQLDHTIAGRIGQIMDNPRILDLVHNKFPLVLVGVMGLGRRFVLHGIFVEHLHALLEKAKAQK